MLFALPANATFWTASKFLRVSSSVHVALPGQRLQAHRRGADVTGDAARMAGPLLQKDRLHVRLEVVVIERRAAGCCLASPKPEAKTGARISQEHRRARGNDLRHAKTPIGANVPFSTACVWS